MHLFVRDLQGQSLSFQADTLPSLQYAVADRTGIPISEQRLSFYGRQLSDDSKSFSEYGLVDGATVGLVLRLRGGGPKKRCGCFISTTDRCSQAAIRIVGDCSFCEKSFCGRHRLPEDHQCPNLQNCKNEAFLKNKNKLESEQTVGQKIESM